jgi:ribosomal protein S18 acetylase RimI-like enzyme
MTHPVDSRIRIRPATLDDAMQIAQVHIAAWQHTYRSLLPAEFLARLSVESRMKMWRESIENNHPMILVADADGTIAGFSAYGPCRDKGAAPDAFEIWALYLLPAHWSQGVGRALWLASRESMRQRGARSVSLWVIDGNERAIGFYRAAGFLPDADLPKPFELGGVQLGELRFVLRLESA